MNIDEIAIGEVHAAWIEAVNAGQLDRLFAMMADDAVFLNPGREPMGRDEFAANFTAAHREVHLRCESALEEVVVAGEVAYTRSRDALAVTLRSGGPATRLAGHRVTIYRRQPDGRWLLARDAHTLFEVAHADGPAGA